MTSLRSTNGGGKAGFCEKKREVNQFDFWRDLVVGERNICPVKTGTRSPNIGEKEGTGGEGQSASKTNSPGGEDREKSPKKKSISRLRVAQEGDGPGYVLGVRKQQSGQRRA